MMGRDWLKTLGYLRTYALLRLFLIFFLLVVLLFGQSPSAAAQTNIYRALQFPFYDAGSVACQPGAEQSGTFTTALCCETGGTININDSIVDNLSAFTPDPAAEKMFNETEVPQIKKFMHLYQKAAQEEGVPFNWEILAGLHSTETNFGQKWESNALGYTGPFQQGPSELREYRDDANYAAIKTLVDAGGTVIPVSGNLADEQFVVLARLALHRWVNQALGTGYEELKTKPIAFQATVDSNNPFWKIMGRWNHGAEGYQGFTGYNDSNYTMPQPITGYGAGGLWNKPGVATTYYLIKKNGISGGSSSCVDGSGNLQPISGDRAELAKRLLDNPNLKLGNFGNASTQKSDIESVVTDDLVRLMVAATEQSGAKLLVNALKSDHDPGSAHEGGKAVDIGYYGNGQPNHELEGNKMYSFLYNNRVGLKIKQLIWKYPPDGYKCINRGQPVDCGSYGSVLDDHNHHIHVGL